ncbi:DUF924 family protein [Litoreibacter janthinus]|uniref:Uncharacterized conserved protein, DUF924 family n=1 Tax=Litoreibacter janthinus TaxID=670154 RepID=A0A1I6H114_9RHOB|nr:DUF924 family protein [Litoreibacter janthinus]SFR48153.1 Uncharacterized conserved protein, DUF924 family [Litoreibacter janthinus]
MSTPEKVLSFWLDEQGEKGWYAGGEALDAEIRDRFEPLWHNAMKGGLSMWMTYPSGVLAYIILTDQFPRNMFRGTEQAFASDRLALAVAKTVISKNWDLKIDEPARQFFYLPLMHSESVTDQERCVRLFMTRMPQTGAGNLLHAKAHREVIRKFGRFPYRNEALDRRTTQTENAYLEDGGYGTTVNAVSAAG